MRFKRGKPYYIKFYDHMIGAGNDEFTCEVIGWVKSSGKNMVTMIYWKVNSTLHDKQIEKDNEETLKIVKKTIIDCKTIDLEG